MARFFQAPIVQPMDYGFKLPFNEIMGALSIKQKEQDTLKAELGKLQDNPLDALAADYQLRGGSVTQSQRNVDAIMYDENGNVRDLTGQTRQIQAEARRQYMQKQTGGVDWGVSTSKTIHDKYLEEIAKNDKLTVDQKNFYTEASQHNYAERGGLGAPQGAGGLYTEGQLFQGIKPAAYVDIPKLGEVYGDKVGQTQIQKSGVQVDPTTSRVISMDDGDFKGADGNRFRQTGTLLTTTYEQIFDATSKGIANNEEAIQYLEHEAKALAWKMGNKNPTPEQINQHVNTRIQEEADRAGHKFMSAKFEPKVYQDWVAVKRAELNNAKALADYTKVVDLKPVEVSMNTVQNTINTKELFEKRTGIQTSYDTTKAEIDAKTGPDGKLLPFLASDPDEVKDYKELQARLTKHQLELDGLTETENLILSKGGFNDANMGIVAISKAMEKYGPNELETKSSLISYIVTGKADLASLSDADKKAASNLQQQMDFYKNNPEKVSTLFSPEMNERALELVNGNYPQGVDQLFKNKKGVSYGDASDPVSFMKRVISDTYKEERNSNLVKTSAAVNATGGMNFQTEDTVIGSTDSAASSYLTALSKGATQELAKNNFAGLVISQGLFKGEVFDPQTSFLKGQVGDYAKGTVDISTIEVGVMPQNTPGRGRGGKPQWAISAVIKDANGKNPKRVPIKTTLDPEKASSMVEMRDQAAMQQLESVGDKLSEQYAQSIWATSTQMLGGTTNLMYAVHDQYDPKLKPGSTQIIKDTDGRPLLGVKKMYSGNLQFYEPFQDAGGNYKVEFVPDKIITDSRANHYNSGKPEFPSVEEFQQLVGEKTYHNKINKKSLDAQRHLYTNQRYIGDDFHGGMQ